MSVPDWMTTISGVVAIVAALWSIWRHIEKRQNSFELHQQRIADKLDHIHSQFGPNGGGLRQAVNDMARKIDKIEQRQIAIGDRVAQLKGEFDQHIIEN